MIIMGKTQKHNTNENEKHHDRLRLGCVLAPTLRCGARCIYTRTAHANAELAARELETSKPIIE